MPWVALSRAVVAANRREEQEQLSRMVRMYDRVRRAAIEGHEAARLLEDLAAELECDLHVVGHDGAGLFPGAPLPAAEVRGTLAAELAARSAGPPAVLRLQRSGRLALAVPVPSTRAALLVVVPRRDEEPSLALLQHVATIVALEVEKLTAGARAPAADRLRAAGLDRRRPGRRRRRRGAARAARAARGRAGRGRARAPGPMRSDMHSRLADRGVAHVLLRRGDTLLVVLDADGPGVDRLLELAGRDAFVGLSSRPVAGVGRVPDAVREARLALRSARAGGRRVVPYGDNDAPFLPRTVGEASAVVDRILGPLLAYDAEHSSELVHSLEEFLRANRSWQRAAETLYVHKQTLVYRIKRIEELTGRRLDDTADVAELWFALQALELTT